MVAPLVVILWREYFECKKRKVMKKIIVIFICIFLMGLAMSSCGLHKTVTISGQNGSETLYESR